MIRRDNTHGHLQFGIRESNYASTFATKKRAAVYKKKYSQSIHSFARFWRLQQAILAKEI